MLALRIWLTELLKRAAKRADASLDLAERFPEAGRYRVGWYDVVRFSRGGGHDTTRFLADHPDVAEELRVPAYARPPVMVTKVGRHDPSKD